MITPQGLEIGEKLVWKYEKKKKTRHQTDQVCCNEGLLPWWDCWRIGENDAEIFNFFLPSENNFTASRLLETSKLKIET